MKPIEKPAEVEFMEFVLSNRTFFILVGILLRRIVCEFYAEAVES